MGQALDVVSTCDGDHSERNRAKQDRAGADSSGPAPTTRASGHDNWGDDPTVSCQQLEDGVKSALATANRGGPQISPEVLINHDLLSAARQGDVKALSDALEKGAWTETRRPLVMKPQKPDNAKGTKKEVEEGMTALMFASQYGSAECVRRLLWASAQINALEEDGWTALHFASKEGHLDVCQALLTAKADPKIQTQEDQSVLQVAEEADRFFAKKLANVLQKQDRQAAGKPESKSLPEA